MTDNDSSGLRNTSDALPDSVQSRWLAQAPASWRPFIQLARIDRPIGWQLLLLPCWWSAALAGVADVSGPNLIHLVLFLIGAIAMRGAGSTYNDIVDRKIDAQVERTKRRPLPSGRVTLQAAKMFLVAQCCIGAAVLFCFNAFTILLGMLSLAIVAIYPFMKRFTSWPQAILGLAFAYGGLMGWAAAFGSLSIAAFAMYLAAIFWTIGYDTIYALQDARDDAIVGVRSTARLFAGRVRQGVGLFYIFAALSALIAVRQVGGGALAYLGVAGFSLHLAWQVSSIKPMVPAQALMLFRANRDAGLILFVGIALQGLSTF